MSVSKCLLTHFGDKSPIAAYKADLAGDVAELVAGGMTSEAAWTQVVDAKLAELKAERARIEAVVAEAYSKTAAGKAQEPKMADEPAAQALAEQPGATVDQTAVATHKDPGEPAEPATTAVVAEAIKTAAENEGRSRSEMRAEALRLIDEAMAKAPSGTEDDDSIRIDDPITERGKKVITAIRSFGGDETIMVKAREGSDGKWEVTNDSYDGSGTGRKVNTRLGGLVGTPSIARSQLLDLMRRLQPDGTVSESDYITINVPGDGEFKILNTKERLAEFRRKVENSPGFKDRQPRPEPDRVNGYGMKQTPGSPFGVESSSGGKLAAFSNMVDEGDLQAALDYAEAAGIDPKTARLTDVLRKRLDKFMTERESAPETAAAVQEQEQPPQPAVDPVTQEAPADQLPNPWELSQDEFVKRVTFAKDGNSSNPWSAKWGDRFLDAENEEFDHPTLGKTVVSGGRYFKTKRDAEIAARGAHKRAVRRAALNGNTPSQEALAAYPDLQPQPSLKDRVEAAREKPPVPLKERVEASRESNNKRLTDAGDELIRNRRNKLKGLAWDDVSALNDTLKVAQVTKPNVWPRPDYAKMIEDGDPAWKAAALKAVYDKIAAAPVTRAAPTDADLRAYIETIQAVREALNAELDRVSALPDGAELWRSIKSENVFGKVFPLPADARALYGRPTPFDRMSEQGKENNRRALLIGGNNAVHALQFGYKTLGKVKDLLAEGFPAKQEAWQKSYEVRATETRDSDVPESERSGQPQQRFYVYEKGSRWRLAKGGQDGGYATQEQAEAFARSLTQKKREQLPPSRGLDLSEVKRTGPDWRGGKNVTAKDIMDHFGFRGVNLGEYVKAKQNIAQVHLNHVYDAFSDLADLLGVPPKAMSLNGTLGVAVGAQGSGKALAHFVPGVNEINITRDSGAGALAHEFGHAVDHYFAAQHGKAVSMAKRPYLSAAIEGMSDAGGVRPEVIEAMRTVMRTINRRPMTEAEAKKYMADQRELNQRRMDRWVKEFSGNKGADPAALAAVAEKIKRGDIGDPQDGDVETNLAEFMRAAGLKPGNAIAANAFSLAYRLRDLADEARFMATHVPQVDTDYAKASAAMDVKKQGDGYWSTPWEKFARAFETFAMDALHDRERESLYLSGLVDSKGWQDWSAASGKATPYPVGEERLAMQQAFQKLVDTIQTRTDDAGNVAMFSRNTGRGVPMPDAEGVAENIRRALPNAPDIILHDDVRKAPAGLLKEIRAAGAENDVEAVYWNGQVHVFPQHIASPERMAFVVGRHEIRHHGIRTMFPSEKERNALLLRMHMDNPALQKAAQAKLDAEHAKTRVDAVEEALADMPVEQVAKLKGFDRLVAAIRNWLRGVAERLRKMDMPTLAAAIEPGQWTDNDVIAFVMKAEAVSRGGAPDTGAMFSRADSDDGISRRNLLLAAAASAVGPANAGATLGKARPIPLAILKQPLPADITKVLMGNGSGTTNLQGAEAIIKALRMLAQTGPVEIRALAAQTADLMPSANVMLTVDTRRVMNAHGAVTWDIGPHMQLFTAGGREGLTVGTLLHEAQHAVVLARYVTLNQGVVRDNDKVLGMAAPKAAAALEQFKAVFLEFKNAARPASQDMRLDEKLRLSLDEARGSPDEFFVRATTDARLQEWMATKEYEGTTLMERFKGWVKRALFGDSGVKPSWLDAALAASADLNTAMAMDSADFARMRAGSQLNQRARTGQREAMFSRAPAAAIRDAVPDYMQQWISDRTTSQRGFNRGWHRTVGTQLHKAKTNPEFGRVFYAVQDFMKDVSRMATIAADKAPDMLPQIDSLGDLGKLFPTLASPAAMKRRKADIKAASDALFDGTLRYTRNEAGEAVPVDPDSDELGGLVWSDDELRERGLSDKAIAMYRQSRNAIDQSLDSMLAADLYRQVSVLMPEMIAENPQDHAALLARIRKAAASERPGEAVRMVRGAIEDRMASLDEILAGDMGEFTQSLQQRRADLEQLLKSVDEKIDRIDNLQANGYAPLMRFGPYAVDVLDDGGQRVYFGLYESQAEANKAARNFAEQGLRVSQSVMSQREFERLEGLSPETALLFAQMLGVEKNEAMQQWLKNAVAEQSALKRHIRRKGIEGFDEDGSRVLAAFIMSNSRAASRALHAQHIAEQVDNVRQGDVKDEAIALVDYVNKPKEEAQALRGLLFVNYIGGSIASALTNLTQTFVQTFPFLSQYGGAMKAAGRIKSAMVQAIGKVADPELAAALDRAEKDGVVKAQEVFQLQAEASRSMGSNLYARSALAAWGSLFQLAEHYNRRVAFIAAYETAKAEGVANPFAFAENAVDETQGIFNKGNRPNLARGAVGATIFTFRQFTIQYVEFLKRLPPKERALALAMIVALSGIRGLPFAEDAEDIIDTVAQRLGYNWTTEDQMNRWLEETLTADWAEVIQRGFSGFSGMPFDVSQRLGMANLLPGTALLKPSETRKEGQVLEVFGVAGSAVRDALRGEVRPVAIRNMAQALDMYETGMYRDTRGRKTTDVDGLDAALKAIGLQPSGVARESRAIGREYEKRTLYNAVKAEITDAWTQAWFAGDQDGVAKARQALQRWNDQNPEAPMVIQPATILRRVAEMRRSRAERFVSTTPREIRSRAREGLM